MGRKRAAVVIGVNRTGGLPPLQGCAKGAHAVADWLRREGFDPVHVFTDEDENGAPQKVTASMLKEAVRDIVDSRLYSQLVIFFSGHGIWKNRDEFWLLSQAPRDSEEAISWTETFELAKDCGIPNVVLISDACRTEPVTLQAKRIRGSVLLPIQEELNPPGQVDKFLATAFTRPAYELQLTDDGEKTSVFTHCLLEAFSRPDADTVEEITENGKRIMVVTNRKLGLSLQRRVPALIRSINPLYEQEPSAEVLSDTYIGRASVEDMVAPASGGKPLKRIRAEGVDVKVLEHMIGIEAPWSDPGFETRTGFVVHGAGIADVFVSPKARATMVEHGSERQPGIVELHIPNGVASVAIRFQNRRGTVLAGLHGYIAHVTVEGRAVTDVSYIPSENSSRWSAYRTRRGEIENLRERTARGVLNGRFRLNDRREAEAFARTARMEKAIDPSLGLYAAYAYSQAGNQAAIESVQEFMQMDLNACLFDVALLATRRRMPEEGAPRLVPFCPMLTQGWNLLRLRKVALPRVVADAQDELEKSLWTVFSPERFDKIITKMTADRRLR